MSTTSAPARLAYRRGDGIGLELTDTIARGVRLAHDEPGRPVAVAEASIRRFDDDEAVVDALIRVNSQLGSQPATARVAWFPDRSTMQRIEATGRTGAELNQMRHELARRSQIDSTMLVEVATRRWMLVLRWDHEAAGRVERLAERAGFVDPSVEPAPVSLGRVLGRDRSVVRRDASDGRSWAAYLDGTTPIAAASVPQASREYPNLVVTELSAGGHRFDDVLGASDLVDTLDQVVSGSIEDAPAVAAELELRLTVGATPYPPHPAHDLRAPQRQAVALGAAIGAAGLAGRLRPVDVLSTPGPARAEQARPWAIERIAEEPLPDDTARRRWWPFGRRQAS